MSSNIRVTRICQHCDNEFIARTTTTKYCGDPCAKRAYKLRIRNVKIGRSNKETVAVISRPFDELKAKEFLSIQDTAALTGVSMSTVKRLIRRGLLKVGKMGKRTIIHKVQLEKLFK